MAVQNEWSESFKLGCVHVYYCFHKCIFIAVSASGATKGSLPGPFPKTPEERAAAAKKYNLRVEDYEPFPDNGEG